MPGRVNHRGWVVLVSIPSDDGALCVDFFEDPAGGFGFEHFRADPEDCGSFTAVGGFSQTRYETAVAAIEMAEQSVSWLARHAVAKKALDGWRATVEPR